MVEKGQALGACSQGVIHRPLHGRVTPGDLLGVLGGRVLGVMDHQVGTGQELDMSLVLSVHRRCSGKSRRQAPRGGSVTCMGLVIDCIDHSDAVGLDAIPERKCRMVQVLGDDAHARDRKLSLDEVVIPDGGVELLQRHREIRVLHLAGERRFELLPHAAWGVEIPLVAGDEQRREEGETLDVIPVRVSNEQVAAQRVLAGGQQRLPEAMGAGTAIQDDERSVRGSHLYAGGVSPVAQRRWAGFGHGPPSTPEPDVHPGPPVSRPDSDRYPFRERVGSVQLSAAQ